MCLLCCVSLSLSVEYIGLTNKGNFINYKCTKKRLPLTPQQLNGRAETFAKQYYQISRRLPIDEIILIDGT